MTDYQAHFDQVASLEKSARKHQRGFHEQIAGILRGHIPEGRSVLEVGSAAGDLLAALKPSRGLGIDLSPKFTELAQQAHAGNEALEFRQQNILEGAPEEQFDAIVLDYLTGYLTDIQQAFENLRQCAHARTRLYINSLNFLWKPLFGMGEAMGHINAQPPSNWLSKDDLINLLELAGWEVVYARSEQLWPYQTPLVSGLCNRFLVRCPLIEQLGCTVFIVARPRVAPQLEGDISCSVIVPARNEAGNIRPALERIPQLGKRTEVIFVEGNSKDDTWEVIQHECEAYEGPHLVSYCQQPGKGKWDAVREGFAKAQGDILVIQDGDLTAPPEDLPKFYEAVASGTVEFANGSRLVYPMESKAMRLINFFGNKFFAMTLSFIIGQPIKDSLCGTKMISRKDYDRLMERIAIFGNFDPFGDFNLIFGSALLDLKIRDVPVRYRDRTYGDTNIHRWSAAKLLFEMSWFGLFKIRFHPLFPKQEKVPDKKTDY